MINEPISTKGSVESIQSLLADLNVRLKKHHLLNECLDYESMFMLIDAAKEELKLLKQTLKKSIGQPI